MNSGRGREKILKKRYDLTCIYLFMGLFLINAFAAVQLRMLHVSSDEMGVLASAAYFTGHDWSGIISELAGYYGFGQSLLYIPLFVLIKDPIILYKSISILNACIISLIPILVYKTVCEVDATISKKNKVLISIAVSVYPNYLIYSKWGWYETLLNLIPWIILYLFIKEFKNNDNKKKIINSCILGAILSYSYAIHGRGLGFIISVVLLLGIYSIIHKRNIFKYQYVIPIFLILHVLFHKIKQVLLNNLWLMSQEGGLVNTLGDSAGKIPRIFTLKGITGLIQGVLGQFFYAITSTYGLVTIGIILAIICIYNVWFKKKEGLEYLYLISLYALILFFVSFGISVVFLNDGIVSVTGRGDYFIYGRYFANTVGILVFLVMLAVVKEIINKKYLIVAGIISTVWCIIFVIFLGDKVNERVNIANLPILNIIPFIGNNPRDYIVYVDFVKCIIITGLIGTIIGVFIFYKKKVYTYIMVIGTFMFVYLYVAVTMIIPNSTAGYNHVKVPMKVINEFDTMYKEFPYIYYIDSELKRPWSDAKLQFSLPEYKVSIYNRDINQIAEHIAYNSIIISTQDLNLQDINNEIVEIENQQLNADHEYMWAYGKEINEYIQKKNMQYSLALLPSQNKQPGKNEIISNKESGFLVYGPYKPLPEGKYIVKLIAEVSEYDKNMGVGFIDMVCNGGDEYIQEAVDLLEYCDENGQIEMYLEVGNIQEADQYELRIYTQAGCVLSIKEMSVESTH